MGLGLLCRFGARGTNASVGTDDRAATTGAWCGENRQTGSAAAASPISRSA
jgi:hypothetical protein